MKCEMIRDLLPLYIDGLTSEESNKEIDKHLKTCRGCKEYYREMTGEINEAAVSYTHLIKHTKWKVVKPNDICFITVWLHSYL